MKKASLVFVVLLAAASAMPAPASAALRAPQVGLTGGNLQTLMNSLNPGITVADDQQDVQRWAVNVSGTLYFKLLKEAGGVPNDNTTNNVLGLYNSGFPNTPFMLLPSNAVPGWFAAATFESDGDLAVSRYDESNAAQGQQTFANVSEENFSYFVTNGGTTGLGQDFLNALQQPRVLVFAGTGLNAGGWFLCFEDGLLNDGGAESQDFDDAIVFVSTVNPATPTVRSSWGALKSRFR